MAAAMGGTVACGGPAALVGVACSLRGCGSCAQTIAGVAHARRQLVGRMMHAARARHERAAHATPAACLPWSRIPSITRRIPGPCRAPGPSRVKPLTSSASQGENGDRQPNARPLRPHPRRQARRGRGPAPRSAAGEAWVHPPPPHPAAAPAPLPLALHPPPGRWSLAAAPRCRCWATASTSGRSMRVRRRRTRRWWPAAPPCPHTDCTGRRAWPRRGDTPRRRAWRPAWRASRRRAGEGEGWREGAAPTSTHLTPAHPTPLPPPGGAPAAVRHQVRSGGPAGLPRRARRADPRRPRRRRQRRLPAVPRGALGRGRRTVWRGDADGGCWCCTALTRGAGQTAVWVLHLGKYAALGRLAAARRRQYVCCPRPAIYPPAAGVLC